MKHYSIIKRMKAMNWKDKNVLVTWGVRFIGSHLAKKLLDWGCDAYIADNFYRGEENIGHFLVKSFK